MIDTHKSNITNQHDWWLSSERMTIGVVTNDHGTIIDAAPIARKFVGQPLSNLVRWMRRQGGFQWQHLGKGPG